MSFLAIAGTAAELGETIGDIGSSDDRKWSRHIARVQDRANIADWLYLKEHGIEPGPKFAPLIAAGGGISPDYAAHAGKWITLDGQVFDEKPTAPVVGLGGFSGVGKTLTTATSGLGGVGTIVVLGAIVLGVAFMTRGR